MSQDDTRSTRRAFLLDLFHQAAGPAGKAFAALATEPPARPKSLLRPPGALPEALFLERCYRCGCCVDVCPPQALQSWNGLDTKLSGTPYIDPDVQGCILCGNLSCMDACPSGALERIDRAQIRIGLAQVNTDRCRRSRGDECRECIARCPVGEAAIRLDGNGAIQVNAVGCAGCGTCQEACPERPRAITIRKA